MTAGNYYYYFGATYSTTTIHYPFNSTLPLVVSGGSTPYFHMGPHGVYPSSPKDNDTVTFSIKITGQDGHAPGIVQLHIGSTKERLDIHQMTYSSGIITTGIIYTVKLNLTAGTYYYQFAASEEGRVFTYYPDATTKLVLVVSGTGVDTSPKLYYGSHSPVNPTTAANVTFNVTYQDAEGDAPNFVRVLIGQPWLNSPNIKAFNMRLTGSNYKQGVKATMSLAIPAGQYGYWFAASSTSFNISIPSGRWYNLTVGVPPVPDNRPLLYSGAHSPLNPTTSQTVTFTVSYKDTDGDAPVYINLKLTSDNRTFTTHNMTWSQTGYASGVSATVSMKLPAGSYYYSFETASTKYKITLGGNSFKVKNLTPPPKDRAPVLSSPSVSPTSPVANQTVTFSVVFSDADGSRPNSVLLHLLWGAGQGYSNFTMTYTPGNYVNGVTCFHRTPLAAGTYYYYFTATSGNLSARAPSSGTFKLDVQRVNYNRSNFAAHADFDLGDDGEVDMNVIETEDGVTISFKEGAEGYIKVELSSDTAEDGMIRLDLGKDLFGSEDLEKIEIVLDGKKVDFVMMTDPENYAGDAPAYYAVMTDDGAVLYLYIPDMDTHVLTAKVKDEESPDDGGLIWLIGAVLMVIVIAALLSLSLLSAAQRRKKVEAYFEDFDTGIRKDPLLSGSLESVDEDDIDWNDLVE
jgi:hypothetical protein